MQVLCSQSGYGCVEGTGYHGQSRWGANYGASGHNCTSYVSFRLAQLGVAQPWRPMGNGNQWDERGRSHVRVDDLPAVGAVAQWEGGTRFAPNPSGHVAYVESVKGDTIEITDDSHSGGTRRVRITRGSAYWPSHFVHIHDLVADQPVADGEWLFAGTRSSAASVVGRTAFGLPGDSPVVGDWDGDGDDTIGLFHDGTWTIANANSGKGMRPRTFEFGQAGDVPVAGDWNGDGRDTVGVFRNGTWLLARSNVSDTGANEVHLGEAGDVPVVGDWNHDRRDTVGTFRDGEWTITDSPFASAANLVRFQLGAAGDRPVVGDWDGVRGDTVGLYRDGTFTLTSDSSATPRRVRTIALDGAEGTPIAGRWERKAGDAVGTVR
jgi:surface antigen